MTEVKRREVHPNTKLLAPIRAMTCRTEGRSADVMWAGARHKLGETSRRPTTMEETGMRTVSGISDPE